MGKVREDTRLTISNECSCTTYNDETEEYTDEPSLECWGNCWDDTLEMFGEDVRPLFELAESFETGYEWGIVGLPLWNRTVSGRFHASNAEELLRAITVNDSWTLRYEVKDGALFANLSHHDAPTGGAMTVKPLPIEDDE